MNIASVHDVHLYHSRNPTLDIGVNLINFIQDPTIMGDLDYLVFPGDFFDKGKYVADDEVKDGEIIIIAILNYCKLYDVKLRVLEGTPSHDFGQSRQFVDKNIALGIDADVVYVKKLDILVEADGSVWGYVPDEWHHDPEVTYNQMLAKMAMMGNDKLDFAVMHGCFTYQLPAHLGIPCHNEAKWLKIVRFFIMIGHHHHESNFDRIHVAGSFERLCHGEEHRKGFLKFYVDFINGTYEKTFIENKKAMPFVTIDVTHIEDTMEAFNYCTNICRTLEKGHVKPFLNPATVDSLTLTTLLSGTFPRLTITSPKKTETVHLINNVLELPEVDLKHHRINMDKENLPASYASYVAGKYDEIICSSLELELKELINANF